MSQNTSALADLKGQLHETILDEKNIHTFYKLLEHFCQYEQLKPKEYTLLAECCLKYVDGLQKFCQNKNMNNSKIRNTIYSCLSIISEISSLDKSHTFVKTVIPAVLEQIIEPPTINLFNKILTKTLLLVIKNTDTKTRISLTQGKFYMHKLCDLLQSCGDYDFQLVLLEILFRMNSLSTIKEAASAWFIKESLITALCNINFENYNIASWKFLQLVNKFETSVKSFEADSAFLDKQMLQFPSTDNNSIWIYFSLLAKSIDIQYATSCLQTNKRKEKNSDQNGCEIVTILGSNITKIQPKKITDGKRISYKVKFFLKGKAVTVCGAPKSLENAKMLIINLNEENGEELLQSLPVILRYVTNDTNKSSIFQPLESGTDSDPKISICVPPPKRTKSVSTVSSFKSFEKMLLGEEKYSTNIPIHSILSDDIKKASPIGQNKIISSAQGVSTSVYYDCLETVPKNQFNTDSYENIVQTQHNNKKLEKIDMLTQKSIIPDSMEYLNDSQDNTQQPIHKNYNLFGKVSVCTPVDKFDESEEIIDLTQEEQDMIAVNKEKEETRDTIYKENQIPKVSSTYLEKKRSQSKLNYDNTLKPNKQKTSVLSNHNFDVSNLPGNKYEKPISKFEKISVNIRYDEICDSVITSEVEDGNIIESNLEIDFNASKNTIVLLNDSDKNKEHSNAVHFSNEEINIIEDEFDLCEETEHVQQSNGRDKAIENSNLEEAHVSCESKKMQSIEKETNNICNVNVGISESQTRLDCEENVDCNESENIFNTNKNDTAKPVVVLMKTSEIENEVSKFSKTNISITNTLFSQDTDIISQSYVNKNKVTEKLNKNKKQDSCEVIESELEKELNKIFVSNELQEESVTQNIEMNLKESALKHPNDIGKNKSSLKNQSEPKIIDFDKWQGGIKKNSSPKIIIQSKVVKKQIKYKSGARKMKKPIKKDQFRRIIIQEETASETESIDNNNDSIVNSIVNTSVTLNKSVVNVQEADSSDQVYKKQVEDVKSQPEKSHSSFVETPFDRVEENSKDNELVPNLICLETPQSQKKILKKKHKKLCSTDYEGNKEIQLSLKGNEIFHKEDQGQALTPEDIFHLENQEASSFEKDTFALSGKPETQKHGSNKKDYQRNIHNETENPEDTKRLLDQNQNGRAQEKLNETDFIYKQKSLCLNSTCNTTTSMRRRRKLYDPEDLSCLNEFMENTTTGAKIEIQADVHDTLNGTQSNLHGTQQDLVDVIESSQLKNKYKKSKTEPNKSKILQKSLKQLEHSGKKQLREYFDNAQNTSTVVNKKVKKPTAPVTSVKPIKTSTKNNKEFSILNKTNAEILKPKNLKTKQTKKADKQKGKTYSKEYINQFEDFLTSFNRSNISIEEKEPNRALKRRSGSKDNKTLNISKRRKTETILDTNLIIPKVQKIVSTKNKTPHQINKGTKGKPRKKTEGNRLPALQMLKIKQEKSSNKKNAITAQNDASEIIILDSPHPNITIEALSHRSSLTNDLPLNDTYCLSPSETLISNSAKEYVTKWLYTDNTLTMQQKQEEISKKAKKFLGIIQLWTNMLGQTCEFFGDELKCFETSETAQKILDELTQMQNLYSTFSNQLSKSN